MSEFQEQQVTETNQPQSSVALVFGILAVVFSALNWLGIPVLHLLGIGFGITGIVQSRKSDAKNGKAALILSIIGLALGAAALIYGVVYSLQNLPQ